ncbi:MAG: site-2 protease family protein [Elusimicrobia bacterium]|nr:site-2 protease family protein [Elusimicrobiota bacterium]
MDLRILIELPLLFFSIICHEFAHGAVAERFGDDTARAMGRLTLSPWPHIDPFGTVLLPILCVLTNAPLFGWAKPVPVNARLLTHRPMSLVLVSGIGPAVNFLLACAAAALAAIAARLGLGGTNPLLYQVLGYMVLINLYLMVFNLLPIHPLDGSQVVAALLPRDWLSRYEGLAPYGFIIIMILMMTGLFGRLISPPVYLLYSLLM